MLPLSALMQETDYAIMGGPYGTAIGDLIADRIRDHSQHITGATSKKALGHGCSALFTPQGHEDIVNVSIDNLVSIDPNTPLVFPLNTFRLPRAYLDRAGAEERRGFSYASRGLLYCLRAERLAMKALEKSKRAKKKTPRIATVGTFHDCYTPEGAKGNIFAEVLPQVFSVVRFCHDTAGIVFETTPSPKDVMASMQAFTRAHQPLFVDSGDAALVGTQTYFESVLEAAEYFDGRALEQRAPSYDPDRGVFEAIDQRMEYLISLCLDPDGRLHGTPISEVLMDIYTTAISENLIPPIGVTINCNSPEVAMKGLSELERDMENGNGHSGTPWEGPDLMSMIVGAYLNADSENDYRKYDDKSTTDSIPIDEFAQHVVDLKRRFNLWLVGACCGGTPEHMKTIDDLLRNP